MLKRIWHKFFGHPNVTDMTYLTFGKLGGGDSDVDGPPNPDANYYRYWRR